MKLLVFVSFCPTLIAVDEDNLDGTTVVVDGCTYVYRVKDGNLELVPGKDLRKR